MVLVQATSKCSVLVNFTTGGGKIKTANNSSINLKLETPDPKPPKTQPPLKKN